MLNTVDEVIKALGGPGKTADLAGVGTSAVSNWSKRGPHSVGAFRACSGCFGSRGQRSGTRCVRLQGIRRGPPMTMREQRYNISTHHAAAALVQDVADKTTIACTWISISRQADIFLSCRVAEAPRTRQPSLQCHVPVCVGVRKPWANQARGLRGRQLPELRKSAVEIFATIAAENSSASSPSTPTRGKRPTRCASSPKTSTPSARSTIGSPAVPMRRCGSSSASWMTFSTIESQAKEPEANARSAVTALGCLVMGSSRPVAGRSATATSELMDVTAGETAPYSNCTSRSEYGQNQNAATQFGIISEQRANSPAARALQNESQYHLNQGEARLSGLRGASPGMFPISPQRSNPEGISDRSRDLAEDSRCSHNDRDSKMHYPLRELSREASLGRLIERRSLNCIGVVTSGEAAKRLINVDQRSRAAVGPSVIRTSSPLRCNFSSGDGLGNHQPGSMTCGFGIDRQPASGRARDRAICPAVARCFSREVTDV